jgi:hypothetical protein
MSRRVLRLIRASKFRPAGTWPDDDYDVFDNGQHTGRMRVSIRGRARRLLGRGPFTIGDRLMSHATTNPCFPNPARPADGRISIRRAPLQRTEVHLNVAK